MVVNFQLRPFQDKIINDIITEWNFAPLNTLAVLPTGAGKTVVLTDIIKRLDVPTIAIAHRQELISQMSITLAKFGIYHRIVGPAKLIRNINQLHVFVLGKSFYDPSSKIGVAGINTLVRRGNELKRWLPTIKLWIQDEAHHLLKNNIWGRGIDMLPNATYGLGLTATPLRADGKGLGSHHDGLFDKMILGPTGRELMDQGFLSDYIIYAPPCNIDFSSVKISATTGDLVDPQLIKATKTSSIMGDIVKEYLKHTPGKLGVSFLPSVELATDVANRFNAAGVPARMVSAKTPDIERVQILKDFEERKLLQLVNVDLFGEGTDIPSLEVVSMGRRTVSFSKFSQMFGRMLRVMEGKPHGVLIDHVGNTLYHAATRGLPDRFCNWSLDRRDRKKQDPDPDLIPLRTCVKCTRPYEAFLSACPHCGYEWIPEARSTPQQVEGDLEKLDPDVLAALQAEVNRVDRPEKEVKEMLSMSGAPDVVAFSAAKRHKERRNILNEILKPMIAQWAGFHHIQHRPDSEIHKRFYHRFGVDILTAQTLGKQEALKLSAKVFDSMGA